MREFMDRANGFTEAVMGADVIAGMSNYALLAAPVGVVVRPLGRGLLYLRSFLPDLGLSTALRAGWLRLREAIGFAARPAAVSVAIVVGDNVLERLREQDDRARSAREFSNATTATLEGQALIQWQGLEYYSGLIAGALRERDALRAAGESRPLTPEERVRLRDAEVDLADALDLWTPSLPTLMATLARLQSSSATGPTPTNLPANQSANQPGHRADGARDHVALLEFLVPLLEKRQADRGESPLRSAR
jgi:hypothetical protein